MDLTRNFIKAKNPCVDGFRWYLRNHAEISDYQGVLDSLVLAGRVEDACWLLAQFGPTSAVLQVDSIEAEAVVLTILPSNVDVLGLVGLIAPPVFNMPPRMPTSFDSLL